MAEKNYSMDYEMYRAETRDGLVWAVRGSKTHLPIGETPIRSLAARVMNQLNAGLLTEQEAMRELD